MGGLPLAATVLLVEQLAQVGDGALLVVRILEQGARAARIEVNVQAGIAAGGGGGVFRLRRGRYDGDAGVGAERGVVGAALVLVALELLEVLEVFQLTSHGTRTHARTHAMMGDVMCGFMS